MRDGGRLAAVFDAIARECEEIGRPFAPPTRIPNTNRALRALEVVRVTAPDAHDALEEALYRATWVDGLAIDDPDVLDELVSRAGAPNEQARASLDSGGGSAELAASMAEAHRSGVAATPAWAFGEFVLPGVQPRALYERIVSKLA